MANGPKCADTVQRYILQAMRQNAPGEVQEAVTSRETTYDGEEAWSIGSVFDQGSLETFETEEVDYEKAYEAFSTLDEVYDAVKVTNAGGNRYDKMEGLHAATGEGEFPTDNRKTQSLWKNDYRDAELMIDGELTERGEMIAETTETLNEEVFDRLDVDAGEAYQKLVTKGYGSTEANNGQKIQAFLMYGSGLSHTDIEEEAGISSSTSRSMAEDLHEYGLLTDDYMFTPEGRDFASVMLDQMEGL